MGEIFPTPSSTQLFHSNGIIIVGDTGLQFAHPIALHHPDWQSANCHIHCEPFPPNGNGNGDGKRPHRHSADDHRSERRPSPNPISHPAAPA